AAFAWNDDGLRAGTVARAVHVSELQAAIDDLRRALGQAPLAWAETVQPGGLVTYKPIEELRSALQ
ncbi:MAG: hypothetical protein WA208_13995, partial [Thermoanaerobaculia bacterium]